MSVFSSFFGGKQYSFDNYMEIFEKASEMLSAGKNNSNVKNILLQAVKLNDNASKNDIDTMNAIACMLAGPMFREMKNAFKLWDCILEIDPVNFNSLFYSLVYRLEFSSKEDALKNSEKFLQLDYKSGFANFKNKLEFMQEKSKIATKKSAEEALSDLYCTVGTFLFENEKYDLAIKALNISIEVDPSLYEAITNIANIYYHKKKDYNKALIYFKKAISAVPLAIQGYARSKGVDIRNKEVESYRKGIQTTGYTMVAQCLIVQGKTAEAEDELRDYFKDCWNYDGEKLESTIKKMIESIKNKI